MFVNNNNNIPPTTQYLPYNINQIKNTEQTHLASGFSSKCRILWLTMSNPFEKRGIIDAQDDDVQLSHLTNMLSSCDLFLRFYGLHNYM